MASIIRAVEPLPLVPVRWMTGYACWGSPRTPTSDRMRSRDRSSTTPAVTGSTPDSRLRWPSSQRRASRRSNGSGGAATSSLGQVQGPLSSDVGRQLGALTRHLGCLLERGQSHLDGVLHL